MNVAHHNTAWLRQLAHAAKIGVHPLTCLYGYENMVKHA